MFKTVLREFFYDWSNKFGIDNEILTFIIALDKISASGTVYLRILLFESSDSHSLESC